MILGCYRYSNLSDCWQIPNICKTWFYGRNHILLYKTYRNHFFSCWTRSNSLGNSKNGLFSRWFFDFLDLLSLCMFYECCMELSHRSWTAVSLRTTYKSLFFVKTKRNFASLQMEFGIFRYNFVVKRNEKEFVFVLHKTSVFDFYLKRIIPLIWFRCCLAQWFDQYFDIKDEFRKCFPFFPSSWCPTLQQMLNGRLPLCNYWERRTVETSF